MSLLLREKSSTKDHSSLHLEKGKYPGLYFSSFPHGRREIPKSRHPVPPKQWGTRLRNTCEVHSSEEQAYESTETWSQGCGMLLCQPQFIVTLLKASLPMFFHSARHIWLSKNYNAYLKAKRQLKTQSKHKNQTPLWQGCWKNQTRDLKQLLIN